MKSLLQKFTLLLFAVPVFAQLPMGGVTVTSGPTNPVVRCATFYTTTTSPYNANFCVGSTAGDLAMVNFGGGFALSAPPSGWNPLRYNPVPGANGWGVGGFWKILSSGDISTGFVTVTWGGSFDANVGMVVFQGGTGGVRESNSNFSASTGSTLSTALTSAVTSTDTAVYFAGKRETGTTTINHGSSGGGGTTSNGSGAVYTDTSPSASLTVTGTYPSSSSNYGSIMASTVRATAPTYSSYWSILPDVNATSSRSNFTGSLGFKFTPASNITIYQLGRLWLSGNSHDHTAYIWDNSSTGSPLASCTILNSSSTDVYGYKYCTLGSPQALTSGHAYTLAVDETNGQDTWFDHWIPTYYMLAGFLSTVNEDRFTSTQGAYPSSTDTPSAMYDSIAILYQ